MSKSFIQAPKPAPISPEAIARFERGGTGQDTQTHIPSNVVRIEPTKEAAEPTRRLSLDLPESLHRRFKTACARHDKKMLREVMEFIERRTAELENE